MKIVIQSLNTETQRHREIQNRITERMFCDVGVVSFSVPLCLCGGGF